MAVTAWKTSGTQSANIIGDSSSWTNPGNVTASDNVWAVYNGFSGNSPTLRMRNFGFSTSDLPSGSAIDGIEVEIERNRQNVGNVTDNVIQLSINSAGSSADRIGSNQASATVWPQTTDSTATYGGSSDKWGSSVTDSQVRGSGFGLDISVALAASNNARVDYVRMRVYYTTSVAYSLTADSGSFSATGNAAGLKLGRKVTAATASYAVTGQTATLKRGRRMTAASGSFALTGQDAALTVSQDKVLVAASASFALTGNAAGTRSTRAMQAAAGVYALTAGTAALKRGYRLAASTGSFAATGWATGLQTARRMVAATATYTLSPATADLVFEDVAILRADAATYTQTGYPATFGWQRNWGFTPDSGAGAWSFARDVAPRRVEIR